MGGGVPQIAARCKHNHFPHELVEENSVINLRSDVISAGDRLLGSSASSGGVGMMTSVKNLQKEKNERSSILCPSRAESKIRNQTSPFGL
jgi:hypothetical protein